MTLGNCITNKGKSGLVNPIKAKAARERFAEVSAALIRDGEMPSVAYQMAADRVADEVSFASAATKRRLLADVAVRRNLTGRLGGAKTTKEARKLAAKIIDDTDFDARAISAMARGRIGKFLQEHAPDLMGKTRKPMRFLEFMKAKAGEKTADVEAKLFADAVNDLEEYFRLKMNALGFNIGKLENRGMAHTHNSISIGNAGYAVWKRDVQDGLDWLQMIDQSTGRPFRTTPPQTFQEEFLSNIYKNITYGRNSKSAEWQAKNLKGGDSLDKHRVLAFKNTDAWVSYNKKYGSADPLNTLMQNIDHMSRTLAVAQQFGRDAEQAVDYLGQLVNVRARNENWSLKDTLLAKGNVALAQNMARFMKGGIGPSGYWGAQSARFFSTTRKTLNASLLDRAVVISVPSDMNSVRMAAKMIGMNPNNFLSTYVGLMNDSLKGGGMTRDDLLRQGHIAESFANPGVTSARYQQEYPAAAWAEIMSNAAMQIQGMTAHTDNAKTAFKHSFAGHFASLKDTELRNIPDLLRRDMEAHGINAKDWDTFRNSQGVFTATNGATFLDPLYWRSSNTVNNPDVADALFLKMQSYVEKWTEKAVPTQSLIVKGMIDPMAWGLAPGSAGYEFFKSAGMFKSFAGAFVINQARMIQMQGGLQSRGGIAHAVELVVTSTIVGAIGIQVGDMLLGRDPQKMDENFLFRSILRGGGLGPVGDVLSTGTTTWGGGFGSYLAGPVVQLGQDFSNLTLGNVAQAFKQLQDGDDVDVNAIPELARIIKRYTPMGQTPAFAGGAAFDRLLVDQFQILLDPESLDALVEAANKRANLNGSGDFWMPGDAMPSRGPNLTNAFGN